MSHRYAALLVILGGGAALALAYWAQYGAGLVPCPLCLWERWPYRIMVALGAFALLSRPPTGRFVLGLAALTMLGGAVIASVHVGVEMNLWRSPLPECNGNFISGMALPMTPAIPCDKPVYIIPGLPVSMALMDLFYELLLALLTIIYLSRKPRRFFR
ncbi:MAG: disulfide bond formation protein B [Acidocella sp.]|nr:disulfide bond formation protein B [Acidocella sp.]